MEPQPTTIAIYCCGSIAKGQREDPRGYRWGDTERAQVQHGAKPTNVVFLSPDDPIPDASTDSKTPVSDTDKTAAQFGRDLYQIYVSSAVIVDARERRGIGVGVELAAATTLGIPVISVLPPDSHYRRSNVHYRGTTIADYIHPHLAVLSTIVDTFAEAGRAAAHLATAARPIHDPWLTEAIRAYKAIMLPNDKPMQDCLQAVGHLQ
jgi:hypothetical protein